MGTRTEPAKECRGPRAQWACPGTPAVPGGPAGFRLKTSPSGPSKRLGRPEETSWRLCCQMDGGCGQEGASSAGGLGSPAMLPTPPSTLPGKSPSPRPLFAQMPASLLTPEPQPRGTILSSLDGNAVGGNRPKKLPLLKKGKGRGEWAAPEIYRGAATSAGPSAQARCQCLLPQREQTRKCASG